MPLIKAKFHYAISEPASNQLRTS